MGGVGNKDGQAETNTVVANPEKDLSGGIHFDTRASGHEYETNGGQDDRDQVARRPADDVKNLGNDQLGHAANDAAHDAHGRRERMLLESRGDPRGQDIGSPLLHGVDKVDDPDPDVGEDEG